MESPGNVRTRRGHAQDSEHAAVLEPWTRPSDPATAAATGLVRLAGGSLEQKELTARTNNNVSSSGREDLRVWDSIWRVADLFEDGGATKWPSREHVEHCAVWRYFAAAMQSLLRIGGQLYQSQSGSKEDWDIIYRFPPEMRQLAQQSTAGLLEIFPQGAEERWLTLAHFAEKPSQRNRTLFVHLLNTVLDLGRVRPRFSWPATGRQVARPQITYSSQSLLFQLALQLCLPLAKPDSFLVCVHCQ